MALNRNSGSGFTRDLDGKDLTAGCLGLLLGPVGLRYKGHWAAGFAWLAMALIGGYVTGGLLKGMCRREDK